MDVYKEGTIRAPTAYEEELVTFIQLRGSRVVDLPGDNLLVEFANTVDAV